MSLVKYCDTNGIPQGVDVTDGSVHVTLTGSDGTPLGTDAIAVNLAMHSVTGTLGALDAVIGLDDMDFSCGTMVFQVSGTWKGKIVVEGAVDGSYNNLSIVQPSGAISFAGINNDNQNGVYRTLIMAGYTKMRLRMSAYTSGTATVVCNGAPLVATPFVWQLNAANLQMTANQSTPSNLQGSVKFIDEAGTPYGIKHISNKPRVSSMPYLFDIAEGNVTGHTAFAKLGYNGDVGSTEEDIITQGSVYYWIPTATALEVLSTGAGAANDTLAGTGVQKVRISYLDADYSAQSQIIDMAGGTPVPLTDTTVLRVNSIRAVQTGSLGVAAGDIICRTVVGTNTVRQIQAGFTRGRGLTYTVPLGKTLYITSIAVSSGYTTAGKVVRWIGRAQVDDTAPTVKLNFFQPFFEIITQDSNFHRDFEMPIVIPATADLKVSAISNGAGSFASCALRGWLE